MTKFVCLTMSALSLAACANPTSQVRSEFDTFKQLHADRIRSFKGTRRQLQFVSMGDVSARPLVFVHGSPGSWEGWVHFLNDPELTANYQVIAIDRDGYGGSGAGVSEPSLKAQAEDTIEILDFIGARQPAIFVGHSYGGPLIAKIAMMNPARTAGLVFVAASVSPDLEKTKWFQIPAMWWPIKSLIPTDLRVCNEEILALKAELTAMMPDWKNISAKTALIQGNQDPRVAPENLDFLVSHLNSKSVVKVFRISDMNHFVPWKRPDLIKQAIEAVHAAL